MAKRRNAPALFELLRESNSTRTGQVGNEDMRSYLGAGVVKNAAPRPPGHPAIKAEAEAAEQAKQEALKAELAAKNPIQNLSSQVASDALVESKQAGGDGLDIESDGLLSMPRFKAGKPASPKPEPVSAPVSKPDSSPTQPPAKVAADVAAAPTADIKAPPASKVTVTTEAKKAPKKQNQPNTAAVPVAMPVSAPASADPKKPEAQIASEKASSEPKSTHTGDNLTISVRMAGMVGTVVVLLFIMIFVIGNMMGRSDAVQEQVPGLVEQAGSTLQGIDGTPVLSGQEDRLIDPLLIASDPAFSTPVAVPAIPDNTETASQEPETAPTSYQIANIDTRQAGSNYLHLAALADSEEARRLHIFFGENGIESYIRVGTKSGRTVNEIITLVGIPSAGWSTSTEKLEHVREIRRLGGIWFNEHGGSIDYSRANQSQWYKALPR